MTSPAPSVPYLDRKRIELESKLLLEAFQSARGIELAPPVPVEEILELHLGLSLAIRPLREIFGVDDVLGAIWFESREVLVDEHLDPDAHPDLEGRFRFTLAHEVGHWRLHRHLHRRRQADHPTFLCRTSQARARVEWQADYFAGALLLPRQLAVGAWHSHYGSAPRLLDDLQKDREVLLEREMVRCGAVPQSPEDETNFLLNSVAAPLADVFCVSSTAMRIRLEHLGLLLRGLA